MDSCQISVLATSDFSFTNILATRARPLDDFQQEISERHNGWNTGSKWQQEDVQPSHKVSNPPGAKSCQCACHVQTI